MKGNLFISQKILHKYKYKYSGSNEPFLKGKTFLFPRNFCTTTNSTFNATAGELFFNWTKLLQRLGWWVGQWPTASPDQHLNFVKKSKNFHRQIQKFPQQIQQKNSPTNPKTRLVGWSMTHCVPRPISMLILQTPQFQTPCTTSHAQRRKRGNHDFFKTILFSCCKKINTKFSIPSFLRSFHLFFLPVWHHSPSPCIFHFFLSIVSNIFLSIVSRVFLSIVSKYFFAPLVVLALTNVPCLTLSPRAKSKTPLLELHHDKEIWSMVQWKSEKGKIQKTSTNGKLFFSSNPSIPSFIIFLALVEPLD